MSIDRLVKAIDSVGILLMAYACIFFPLPVMLSGGDKMSKKEIRKADSTDLRIDPEKRLCPKFDSASIALFPVATREEMGVRVVDDCAEEHIM